VDLVIRNGKVVTASGVVHADVGIEDEHVVAIAPELSGRRSIDAEGHLVLPGFVDAHVHLQMLVGDQMTSDDFRSGTIAAACGGTTTIVDFTGNSHGDDLAQAVQTRRAQADGSSVVDYALHLTLADASERTLSLLPRLAQEGHASAKMYTTYESVRLVDEEMLPLLETTSRCGILPMVHTENHAAIAYLTARLLREGKTAPRHHPDSRPPVVEAEAAHRVATLAALVDAPFYMAHVTCRETLDAIRRARARGQLAYAETCPQYLFLSREDYHRPGFEAAKYVLSPPLRTQADQAALWEGLSGGDLQVVSTDHCPWNFNTQKVLGKDDFSRIPNGAPGIETRVPLLYSEGVGKGRLTLGQFVSACSTQPALLHGLYPRKGTIAVGSDADLVIFDPDKQVTLSYQDLHQRVDYCPFEGMQVTGYPRSVILRGTVIVQDGEFVGEGRRGRFITGRPFSFLQQL